MTDDAVTPNAPDDRGAEDESVPRVLLVEDYWVNQKVALRMLAKLGIDADTAVNGEEALEAISSEKYDIVFMDCQMPVMDGFAATAAIRSLEDSAKSSIPIIAMTANAMSGDKRVCLDAGMDGYISKPIHVSDLDMAIKSYCFLGDQVLPETR